MYNPSETPYVEYAWKNRQVNALLVGWNRKGDVCALKLHETDGLCKFGCKFVQCRYLG